MEGKLDPQGRTHTVDSNGKGYYDDFTNIPLDIPVADMDGDGDLDIVVTGKWGGPVIFENKLKSK